MIGKKEFGDYQTPKAFSDRICSYLKEELNLSPDIIIEPTCGKGSFIESSLLLCPKSIFGIEVNTVYVDECIKRFSEYSNIKIINESIFGFKTADLCNTDKSILILGNPPWVTNTELSSIESTNLPNKVNFKHLRGFDAITGASNFDICEYIILQLINEYCGRDAYFALICKTSVSRNVYEELINRNISFDFFECLEFDSKKVFNINASACVLVFKLSSHKNRKAFLTIKNFDSPRIVIAEYQVNGGKFCIIHNQDYIDLDGKSCFEWRQGVKHDCSKIMELRVNNDNSFVNGKNETVNIENSLVFPLVKSSMFKSCIKTTFEKYVIITQSYIKQDTSYIREKYPNTWEYLNKNVDSFYKRKSSIYNNSYPFSIFGIGDYSFAKYKVGVSGFYKKPLFSLLYSEDKPVMIDDTGYFISFNDFDFAYTSMLLLNSDVVQSFLESLSFKDAKRPFTKRILSRLDFKKAVENISYEMISNTEKKLELQTYITESMYTNFKNHILQDRPFLI